jgi:hypothetical protein
MDAHAGNGRANVVAFRPRERRTSALEIEAARRIERIGYGGWLARERATGLPVPSTVRYLKAQIEFAAKAMAALDPLPENFRADHFWPA